MRKLIGTIFYFAVHDWKKEYTETFLGVFWTVIKPIIYILTYSFFMGVVRNGRPVDGHTILSFLFPGTAAWLFCSESINRASGVFRSYSLLITDVKFPVIILPLIQMISRVFTHAILLLMIASFAIISTYALTGVGDAPIIVFNFSFLHFFTTFILMFWFLTAITFLLGSLAIFLPDIKHIVSSLIQIIFWFSGIIIPVQQLDAFADGRASFIIKLFNPIYYFVLNYRSAFLDGGTYTYSRYDAYMLVYIGITTILSLIVYKITRPIMADRM